jgi:hypothetical protein
MTGSPRTGHSDSNGPGSDRRADRFPWQLGFAVLAWVILGAVLVVSALTVPTSTSEADQASINQVQGTLGSSAVATDNTAAHRTLWLLLGLAVLLAALLLLIGQGWARHALAVLGVVAVIVFAINGRWEAIVAFAALVLGTVPLLAPSAHRYLSSR